VQDSTMLQAAHRALGTTLMYRGAAVFAQTHFAQGIALYDPKQHRASVSLYGEDTGGICHCFGAWTLGCPGYPDQGIAQSEHAVLLAEQIAYPYNLGYALSCSAVVHQFRREEYAAQERAEAAISLATEQGFPLWRARGAVLRGWALAQQGQAKEGIDQ